MIKTAERLRAVMAVEAQGFEYRFTKEFSEADLADRIQVVALAAPPKLLYNKNEVLQRELLTNEDFPALLKKFQESLETVPVTRVAKIITDSKAINKRITDYPTDIVQDAIVQMSVNDDAIVPYILSINSNKKNRESFIGNLNAICGYGDFFRLSPEALALFDVEYLSGYIYASSDRANQVCEMLAAEPVFQEMADYLFTHTEEAYFDTDELEKFKENPREALDGFKTVYELLGNVDLMDLFFELWRENCSLKELAVLPDRLSPLSAEERETAMQSKSAYISMLYGKAVNGIDLTALRTKLEDIIIYALSEQKRGFIRLIEQNAEAFLALPNESLLLDKEFYTQYINLNALNANNLKEFAHMPRVKIELGWLDEREYTFEEIKAQYGVPWQYLTFYNSLSFKRVDERLLALRQVVKKKLLAGLENKDTVSKIATILSEKPLYTRIHEDFSHIRDIKAPDVIQLLLIYDKIGRLVPQMKDRLDVALVLRNQDDMKNFATLDEAKRQLERIDISWGKLRELMEFDDNFVERNLDQIIRFLVRDGAQIALTYYSGGGHLTDSQKDSFKRIVKAELMGEFSTLKYYRDDLSLEVDYPITDEQKLSWRENKSVEEEGVSATENDDFYSTMLLGVQPQRTCMSYIDGQYRECLLSNFDTSKKILYAEMGGKVVGRALLRLTKGRFHDSKPVKRVETLAFVDIEDLPNERKVEEDCKVERLALFLERPYISGISPDDTALVHASFVKLAESKADALGAMLVLNQSYTGAAEYSKTEYAKTHINLFISRSKSGKQYIDSLNGSAEITDEGSYRSNTFLIRQKDI